jgi:phospholipid/cholesterol/gamma-HCH transport system substrate-binding protein
MTPPRWWRLVGLLLAAIAVLGGCEWRGINSLRLPGTAGNGQDAFVVQAQLPDVTNLVENSRVRVGDVTVGSITKIEQQGWHALVTMRLDPNVDLPENATATVGQTSLLGSLHVELAPPTQEAPRGRLHDGTLIPLSAAGSYPTTEQTLAALSLLLNNGGLGKVHDITTALTTALAGREPDARTLIDQLDRFVGTLNDQVDDIITATDNLNHLAGGLAQQQPVLNHALETIPASLAVLKDQRHDLTNMLVELGQFSALATHTVDESKDKTVQILNDVGPVLQALANAGPALTRSLSQLTTFPWPKETLGNWIRGDLGNASVVVDLTLSRLDSAFLTGTRFEGNLTELEMQWGRTIGQFPSPYTAGNPLIAPYHSN